MTKHKVQPKQRHIPERTCVACRIQRPKRALVRVVHTPTDEVTVDEGGKMNGRGAYLCQQRICWEKALKQGSLERALHTTLSVEAVAMLRAYAAGLPEVLPAAEETVVA